MSEKIVTLMAKIVKDESKEPISTVSRTLAFAEHENEEIECTKTLDDFINEFIDSIERECGAKGFKICNKDEVYCYCALGLALSLKSEEEEEVLEIPVLAVKNSSTQDGGSHENDDRN